MTSSELQKNYLNYASSVGVYAPAGLFLFVSLCVGTSPRPSRRLASSESGQLPYPRNATIRPHVRFPCEFLLPDSNTIRRNGKRCRRHGRFVTQNASRPDIDYRSGGIRFYRFPDSRYRFSRRLAIFFTTSSSSNPSTHPTANPAASPIEPATTHWTTA